MLSGLFLAGFAGLLYTGAMAKVILIAALTWPGRVIGRDGGLVWKLSEDLKRFKALTLGHPVVMGRKTWDSLPFKLPGRSNLVVSHQAAVKSLGKDALQPDGLYGSLDSALAAAALMPGGDAIYVMGGAQLYEQALPKATGLALTFIHHPFEGDAYFPAFDLEAWKPESVQCLRQTEAPAYDYEFLDLKQR